VFELIYYTSGCILSTERMNRLKISGWVNILKRSNQAAAFQTVSKQSEGIDVSTWDSFGVVVIPLPSFSWRSWRWHSICTCLCAGSIFCGTASLQTRDRNSCGWWITVHFNTYPAVCCLYAGNMVVVWYVIHIVQEHVACMQHAQFGRAYVCD
jgi:hypothetical protein